MGYDIPIYYFPVKPSEIVINEVSVQHVRELIAEKYKNAVVNELYETNSHSWWHQNTILKLCTNEGIIGLEFLENEIAYLDANNLINANKALTLLINFIRNGIPVENKPDDYIGVEIIRKVDFKKAFMEATPSYNVESLANNDFEEAVSFYSFLKSLHKAIEDALSREQHLLYYRPKP
jgi:hypothetical protein